MIDVYKRQPLLYLLDLLTIMYAITLSTIATLTHNTTPITIRTILTILTMQHPTITTKIIVVQTQILEDAADIEDNLVSILKAYSTKHVL